MTLSLVRLLFLCCVLTDLTQVGERAGQMHDLHHQLVKAAREL